LPTASRRVTGRANSKGGLHPTGGKRATRKAASVLTDSRLLPDTAKAGAVRALEVLVQGVRQARDEAREVRVEMIFTPRGRIVVGSLARPSTIEAPSNNEAAIAAAMERGAETVAKIISQPDMLTGEDFARLVGMSRMAVHKKLKKQQILGIEGAKRGVRYPKWQLDDEGRPISGLAELLPKFGDQTWAAYRFLRQQHPGLGNLTALSALKAGKKRAVLEAADTVISGDFS